MSQNNVCPCCNRPLPKPKASPAHPGPDATDEQLRAFYRATAPVEDLKFTLRNASPALQVEIIKLLQSGKPTAKDAARMRYLRRIELAAAERVERAAAVGTMAHYIAEGWRAPNAEPDFEGDRAHLDALEALDTEAAEHAADPEGYLDALTGESESEVM